MYDTIIGTRSFVRLVAFSSHTHRCPCIYLKKLYSQYMLVQCTNHSISGVSPLAQVAPQTCELIKTRPEINDCKFMNVNYVPCPPKCQESVMARFRNDMDTNIDIQTLPAI